ncbi:angiopoietin-related protein 6 isoform X2 [Pristis pectinata]|uniref:angiopoietin-related protein 6 isoform X2 n=1 Tax=Pristis pectinata TaxID=685728 RepID=UPI00223D551C|nr:angiopoietin-related protein 6 isoform X2 [Pristis pectinata]
MLKLTISLFLLIRLAGAEKAPTGTDADDRAQTGEPNSRNARSPESTPSTRCTYTFIVPQQRLTGPICLSTKALASGNDAVNKSELLAVRDQMREQQQQIEDLRQMVELDGGVIDEVKSLRKESRNMNSRVSQLYAQLLHEIIQKKDDSLEISRLENKVLNVTAEVLRLSIRYRDLERKYTALTTFMNNQSRTIAQLEEQCRQAIPVHNQQNQQGSGQASLVTITANSLNGSTNKSKGLISGNEILRDQVYSMTQDRLKRMEQSLPTTVPIVTTTKSSGPWKDCLQVLEEGHRANGIYLIKPKNINRLMQVWCEQQRDTGGWTVIQRRQDGSVNFFRTWENYKQGFGNIDGEYWLGLENIYWLTNQDDYKLLILMDDWQGRRVFAEYDNFHLESERDFYRLRLGYYHGNAGDSLSWHNNKQFTTLDRDRDQYSGNCAHYQKGGWWYYTCAHSNLNGVWYKGGHYRSKYQDGVYWAEFRGGAYSLKRVVMMIRPS